MKQIYFGTRILLLLCLLVSCSQAQWQYTNGPSAPYISCLFVHGSDLFAGTHGYAGTIGVSLTTDNGVSWTDADNGLVSGSSVSSFVTSGDSLFVATSKGIFLSTNNGSQWTSVTMPNVSGLTISYLAMMDNKMYAAGNAYGRRVFWTTDNGSNWRSVSTGLPDYSTIYGLAVIGTCLFAGSNKGVSLLKNGDTSWTSVNNNLAATKVIAMGVCGTTLFVGNDLAGVFVSADSGAHWAKADSGMHGYTSMQAFAVSGNDIFVATSSQGVYLSTNDGTSWTGVDTAGMGGNPVLTAIALNSTYLFIGTDGSGVYRKPLSQIVTGVEKSKTTLPDQFSLLQNYPNPFNPATTISYQIPTMSHVMLKVYDILGREVATLVDQKQDAGTHTATFDGSRLSSGVYLCRLQAGTAFIKTMKLVLNK
ncbi:MAG: T9SS type A sorting domain-containing protein [Bacteroidota bacterium]|nr:T9SS type A sorting domain-containing protein [Bacteroidota bacterium]